MSDIYVSADVSDNEAFAEHLGSFYRTGESLIKGSNSFVTGESNSRIHVFDHLLKQPSHWQPDSSELKFKKLADKWRDETILLSSERDTVLNSAYQEIIGMGPKALPFILSELEERSALWFWALRAITGLNPVKPKEEGKVEAMRNSWLNWARENGQLPSQTPFKSALKIISYA